MKTTNVTTPTTGPEYFEEAALELATLPDTGRGDAEKVRSAQAALRAAAAQARENAKLQNRHMTDWANIELLNQSCDELRQRAESAESKLAEAQAELNRCRDTFKDLYSALLLFGKPTAAQACVIAIESIGKTLNPGTDTGAPT